jgi:hypothetical protein
MSSARIRHGVAALLLASAFVAQAQQTPPPPAGGPPQGARPGMERSGRRGPPPPTAELVRELGLNDAQAKALDGILERHRERMAQARQRAREQHEEIVRGTDAELRKLLDARQYERFEAWRAEHRPPPPPGGPGRGRGHPGGPPDRDGPPPPPFGPPPPDGEG